MEITAMQAFTILYRTPQMLPLDPPRPMVCDADSSDEAEEDFAAAKPDCEIVWVVTGDDPDAALADYYGWDN
jgi:hypothetical protein